MTRLRATRSRDFDREHAERLERNRRRCPLAERVVDILFDLARTYPDIEELAIRVDGATIQTGHELTDEDYGRILSEASRLMEKK